MKYRISTLIVMLATGSSPALAGSASGTAYNIISQNNGVVIFAVTGTHTGNPTCSTTSRFAFLSNTSNGQAMLATLLTGYTLGKTENIVGDGTCSSWGDSENVQYVTTP